MAVGSVVGLVLGRLKDQPLEDCPLAEQIGQCCFSAVKSWRDRLLTPMVTFRLFLMQILNGNTSIAHLRQLAGLAFAPSSYGEARGRLPLAAIAGVLDALVAWAREHVMKTRGKDQPLPGQLTGQRVLVVDGSSFTTADTPELRSHFGRCPGTRPGIGYPMGKLLGLLDLATGLFVAMLAMPVLISDASMVASVHPSLLSGDILLGDRAFCSFAHYALLSRRGVFACCRLHQSRKTKGKGRDRWHKSPTPPAWINAGQFASLPSWLDVRIVSYAITTPGFRTKHVVVATTLMDESLWPDERIAALYGHRWEIETCFNHLKTTMKMNVLRCKTVDGVAKELAMYLIAYNLVRLAMLQAADKQKVSVGRVSFIDALRYLAVRIVGLPGVTDLIVNPRRPGRWEPRVIRRRLTKYSLMTKPRDELKQKMKAEDSVEPSENA